MPDCGGSNLYAGNTAKRPRTTRAVLLARQLRMTADVLRPKLEL